MDSSATSALPQLEAAPPLVEQEMDHVEAAASHSLEYKTTPSIRTMTLWLEIDNTAYDKFIAENYGDEFVAVRVQGKPTIYDDRMIDSRPDTFLFVRKTCIDALHASPVSAEAPPPEGHVRLRMSGRTWIDLDPDTGLVVNPNGILRYDPACTVIVPNDAEWCHLLYKTIGTSVETMQLCD